MCMHGYSVITIASAWLLSDHHCICMATQWSLLHLWLLSDHSCIFGIEDKQWDKDIGRLCVYGNLWNSYPGIEQHCIWYKILCCSIFSFPRGGFAIPTNSIPSPLLVLVGEVLAYKAFSCWHRPSALGDTQVFRTGGASQQIKQGLY